MSEVDGEFHRDAHELVRKLIGVIAWISGTWPHVGAVEASGDTRAEAVREAGSAIAGGLESVASALESIALELGTTRRAAARRARE